MRKTLQTDKTRKTPLFPSEQELCTAKILIIDDEETYLRALEWALRRAGFSNFQSLTDSARAQGEFKRYQPDLVVLDWHMPGLDGFTVLKQLRESEPAGEFLPVLVLTGDNTWEIRSQALKAGASDFLGKPIDHTEVTLRIKNLLQTRILQRQARKIQTQLEALTAAKEAGAQPNRGKNDK